MYTQNNIVLSIGTNQGDKMANIQKAIDLIHKHIGTVIKVSPIYEFPAWGFQSEAFFNCALLIHSTLEGEVAISKILEIEKTLGRIRSNEPGYIARIIDIDIISFNQEVHNSSTLTIPHPLMQDRRFVLLPAADLNLEWSHPILKKSYRELLKVCPDQTEYKLVGTIEEPISKYGFTDVNFIAIEGNIGAGKTTLTTRISDDFNAKLILEGFADNPFLPKFYKDATRYAFPLEMSFLADRYNQLSDDLAQYDLFKEFVIADYYIYKSLIFAQITLEEDEFRLYHQIFEIMYKETPQPDLYVFLYQNTDRLLDNIKKRGRSYESDITSTYLDNVNQGYLNYVKTLHPEKVLTIDISDLDFVANQEDYIHILNLIQDKLK
ncbi:MULTISPECIES: 2-amino-4-hydroxy-6-hydroxymethyldihydropteridine diphosphokinase [Myroides]|uniref:2-amino-4-hydroxy-6-hydroxymethyldihydropteridine pyrophosphokinase n=1 Tax=Myroides albus TaxID=2562892 RepID=A0A6I3LG13_9FLAO|nr:MULTISPECIES: 2-amino-4-hydroxy-6-hydroxymethyldihydropteridine diphosphokinase [Myroides]MTG97113.1 2-amino-4-hydroxy-6-hydroxymethyldihydropteridine diphosphokinase [Myroides albus]MVX34813.1 2-amino-4-hydroxy-6-hydroxymethyldihydropteridine diphosphokinase [Myroides sp. LoEW2-1]UVD78464.1 2-amino-4-hydroxy-6-hydroxymethyldihydropteridine diphosphokinase [Myroides albus]